MIALLTDFGQSEYVGVMKGVICSINADAKVVDLCHAVSAQCIIEAVWILKSTCKYFAKGTVFCCVVDPAVGTPRKAIAVKTINYYFVAPDNGLLWATLQEQRIVQIRQITVPKWSSRTFHGRDVFAPAAANIGLGRFDKLGPLLNQIKKLDLYRKCREGMVVRIDGFGSVITNLPKGNKRACSVHIADKTYRMYFCPVWSRAGLKLR